MKLCHFEVGLNHPLFLIAGPCVIESEAMAMDTAGRLKEITSALGTLCVTTGAGRNGETMIGNCPK